ncbi:unnamed protein product [Clonostachys rosea]|uniref:DNA damage-binding protein 1 n=1 Tax=Bionectria ochroleuca TaxID=29856 RepID=A0ABY6U1C8_BIOOC|nr:unnamed protein product [Clonostachys rosea]
MSYIAPVHLATSIRHALWMRFLSPDQEDLVLSKANRIEIWQLDEDGLTKKHSVVIYGTIVMLQRLQPKDSETDLLFVGTDRQHYFTLAWNSETKEVETVTEKYIHDEAEPFMRHSQSQNKCLVDPTGKFVVMHLWEGVLTVFKLRTRGRETTRLDAIAQVRHTELWLKASAFIHSRTGHPRIVFLYKSQQEHEEARIAVYRLTKDDRGGEVSKFDPQKDRELDEKIKDPYASMIIPVPVPEEKRYHVRKSEGTKAHLGGFLVIGETLLTYFDSLTYTSLSSGLKEPRIYISWAQYDATHYFLADDYGRMDLLTVETANEPTGEVVTGLNVCPMKFTDADSATAARATKLVYLGQDILFLASHHGDPQLLLVNTDSKEMTLLKSFPNNAPILDFAIMDIGNREGDHQTGNAFSSGQARIVAGCGAYQDGSLRSIRSGVGLEDWGILFDQTDTRALFTLKSYGVKSVDTLVVSLIDLTRVFKFDADGGVEEVFSHEGITMESETLLVRNLPTGQVLQVTPRSVALLDPESGVAASSWASPEGKVVTAASANEKWLLLAIDGSVLVRLNLENDLEELSQSRDTGLNNLENQISCIHAAQSPQNLGVVGWWASGTISIIDLATLEPIHGESLRQSDDSASIPRDIALVQLHPAETAGPTLFIATEDGNVITFNVSIGNFEISGRKTVTLGNGPSRFHLLPHGDGECSIFVTTEFASLIYSSEGRIIYSATTADDATFVAPFDSEAFPGSIIISTNDHVKLSFVDRERLTHVKPLHVRETVRRIAYTPDSKAFAIACIKKELVQNEEIIINTIKLVDEIIFQEQGTPFLLDGSTGTELVECLVRATLNDSNGNPAERLVVGTSFVENSPSLTAGNDIQGRILVLGIDQNRQLYQIKEIKLRGNCRCLGIMGDHIVAGLSKTVVVFSYSEDTTASAQVEKLASYRPSSIPVSFDITGNIIGIVDLSQSMALVEFVPRQGVTAARLDERARHYHPSWSTAICALDDEKWLEADSKGNLVVLRQNKEAPLEQDQKRMDIISELNIGEQINRIRRLHVAPDENAAVWPKAFLASSEGSVYMYGEIAPGYQDLLINFQSSLARHAKPVGDINFDLWRAYRSEARETNGPFRFLDGEMLERFLDMNESMQEEVCEGLGPSVEDMRNIVEELRRLH